MKEKYIYTLTHSLTHILTYIHTHIHHIHVYKYTQTNKIIKHTRHLIIIIVILIIYIIVYCHSSNSKSETIFARYILIIVNDMNMRKVIYIHICHLSTYIQSVSHSLTVTLSTTTTTTPLTIIYSFRRC